MSTPPSSDPASAHRPRRVGLAVAWLALIVLAHEGHEMAHNVTGRLACGRWAVRDFSRWAIEGGCQGTGPTLAGPLFSYLLMALGAWLCLRRVRPLVGVMLVAAANPLARWITAVSGHGDEQVVLHAWMAAAGAAGVTAIAIVSVLTLAAMAAAWRATAGWRLRPLAYTLAMLAAILVTGPGSALGNRWLQGMPAGAVVAGAPWPVHAVTALAVLLALASGRAWWPRREGSRAPVA